MASTLKNNIDESKDNCYITHKIDVNGNNQLQFKGEIPSTLSFANEQQILVISKRQSYLTHGIHKFPAKFFPELPRYLITKYSKIGQTVIDPMSGSGTVPLEAVLVNRKAIAVDIDPIAKLVTKVKTTALNTELVDEAHDKLKEKIEKLQSIKFKPKIPEFNYRENWFKPHTLMELGIIKHGINEVCEKLSKSYDDIEINNLQDFLMVIFSSIIRDASNADPHCTRTVIRAKLMRDIKKKEAFTLFNKKLAKEIPKIKEFSTLCDTLRCSKVKIPTNADARQTGLEESTIDLAVTSPPYINAVDYPRTHQLELYWLGLANGGLSKMKRDYIGTEVVYTEEYKDLHYSGYDQLDELIKDVYNDDKRRAYIIYRFFMDMEKNLIEMKRILKPNARYCVAIGNNLIRGRNVDSNKILMEIAQSDKVGFEIENYFFSGVINHFIKIPRKERMLGEWVTIYRNSK